ncbi:hypothetical protein L3Q82_016608 [Scortum barcoo]|uniref:Uncharacterized protein n=1 Tax=Scortum barcoo TaxID=214431 RepID=A0ACB8X7P9_9TELE|nr:hypothetical protein L3Q82_016608 [Scortum barcoo]
MILFFCNLAFSLIVISFCSLSVLRVLTRPGPGEEGGNKGKINAVKQWAFVTIVAIMAVLLLMFVGNLVCLALASSSVLSDSDGCVVRIFEDLVLSAQQLCAAAALSAQVGDGMNDSQVALHTAEDYPKDTDHLYGDQVVGEDVRVTRRGCCRGGEALSAPSLENKVEDKDGEREEEEDVCHEERVEDEGAWWGDEANSKAEVGDSQVALDAGQEVTERFAKPGDVTEKETHHKYGGMIHWPMEMYANASSSSSSAVSSFQHLPYLLPG